MSASATDLPELRGTEIEPLMKAQPTYLVVPADEEDLSHLDDEAGWLQEQRISHQAIHWLRRPSIIMIGICLFLMTFAVSSAEASRQVIQYKLACNSVSKDLESNVCDPTEAQILLLTLQQALQVTLAIATIIASSKVPSLSDQYGRKIFITLLVLFLLIGRTLRYFITSCFPVTKFGLMIMTEVIGNSFGGIVTMLALANCYASDISEPDQRTHYLGINMAFFFTGLSTGPMAGNFLLSHFAPSELSKKPQVMYGPNLSAHDFLPLRFELGVIATLLVFALVVLPEARSKNARRMSRTVSRSLLSRPKVPLEVETTLQKFFRIFNIFRPLRIIFYPKDYVNPSRHDSIIAHRTAVMILIFLDCAMVGFSMSLGEIFVLYGIYRHKMTALDLGLLLIIGCSCRAFCLIVVTPILNKCVLLKLFGLKTHKRRFDRVDYSMVAISFFVELIGLIALANAGSKKVYLSIFAFSAFSSMASPALNSSTVKFFPESKIGEVFGAMALAKNFFNITFPLLFLGLYKFSLRKWQQPEFVFYIVSFVFFSMFLGATYAIRVLEQEDRDKERRDSSVCSSSASSVM